MVRYAAQRISADLKQPVVVQNRGSAGGRPALMQAAQSHADGYTILHGYAGTISINPGLYKQKLEYWPERDFTPIAPLCSGPLVLYVHPSVPARTLAEFVAYAKANPGKLSYASSGIGSTNHFAGELFKATAGFESLHVPFNGSAPAHTAMMGGHVSWTLDTGFVMQYVRAGRLNAIAVAAPRRIASMDLPAIAETYPGFDVRTWHGLFAPMGTPRDIILRLNRVVNAAMREPEGQQVLAKASQEPFYATPEEFGAFVAGDIKKWAEVAVQANIKPPAD